MTSRAPRWFADEGEWLVCGSTPLSLRPWQVSCELEVLIFPVGLQFAPILTPKFWLEKCENAHTRSKIPSWYVRVRVGSSNISRRL